MELTSRLSRLNKQMLITPGRDERCVSLLAMLPGDMLSTTGLTLRAVMQQHFQGSDRTFRVNCQVLHLSKHAQCRNLLRLLLEGDY